MVVLEVTRLESGIPYIAISALEASLRQSYEQSESDIFIVKFNAMMLGSTVAVVNDETAIYPHDISAIFDRLKIPVKFVDANGKELAVNGSGSGVPWHCHSLGAAAGILKNIQTNKQYSDDESLQSALDDDEEE
jgi:hypothetical protein